MTDIVKRLRDGCGCNFPETTCMAESECSDAFEAAAEITRLRAENERLRKIINSCHWYWDAEDCEECYHAPWDIVNDADDGVICEVWRGGMVETMFVARVGDDCVNEPSMDAAQAKVSELKARAALEGSDD